MEPNAILFADPLDLLFENRNKNYGAYPLRKYYDRRMMAALGLSLSSGLLVFITLFSGPQPVLTIPDLEGPVVVIQPPPDITPVRPKPPVALKQPVLHAAASYTNLQIVRDDASVKPVHTIEELGQARIGVTDIIGPPETATSGAGPAAEPGPEATTEVKEAAPEIYRRADVMPQFPGGEQALLRFLSRNLRMPEDAEAGTKVSVMATFVVGTDGKVRQAEMTRSGGLRFDAEVKRVLAKMPDWIPGRVGEKAVAVYFTLPVQFVVPEE